MAIPAAKNLKADDYLGDLANQSGEAWLKSLIEMVISTRAVPDKRYLDGIYVKFLTAHKLRVAKQPDETEPAPRTVVTGKSVGLGGFVLKSLQHESGVNALVRGATIPFHPKLTVVYGKNGSGKSGFVRILKRVAGSRTQEEVWQNIHGGRSQNRCKAKIAYARNPVMQYVSGMAKVGSVPLTRWRFLTASVFLSI